MRNPKDAQGSKEHQGFVRSATWQIKVQKYSIYDLKYQYG